MNSEERMIYDALSERIKYHDASTTPLPGLRLPRRADTFIKQVIASSRRVKYVQAIRKRKSSDIVGDPLRISFDPLRASLLHFRNGDYDEACWLVFYFTHFGRHAKGHWRYAREVYAGEGPERHWTWARTSADPKGFRNWLAANREFLTRPGIPGGFGNHRKYESLHAYSPNGTGAAFESYIQWIGPTTGHAGFFESFLGDTHNDPGIRFDDLYKSMNAVKRFGRTARFDYLTMLGKLSYLDIMPSSPYLQGATGPLNGAKLMFFDDGNATANWQSLEQMVIKLGNSLNAGMQVMEDSLCNWQKSPNRYIHFSG